MNIVLLTHMIVVMVGLYFVTIGLWELRMGTDRKKYAICMFTGLFLIFVFSNLLGVGLNL